MKISNFDHKLSIKLSEQHSLGLTELTEQHAHAQEFSGKWEQQGSNQETQEAKRQ